MKSLTEFFFHFWPKIIFKDKRAKVRDQLRRVTVSQRQRDLNSPAFLSQQHVDPWAFIRVKNERATLLACLNSILPVVHRGVIAYNLAPGEYSDGSEKIIESFCQKHPGFIPFHYPYYVEPAHSKNYLSNKIPFKNTLAGYYSATLAQIPKHEWVLKIDVDQIYITDALLHTLYLPQNTKDVVNYSRLDVVRDTQNNLRVSAYERPGDQLLIFNDDLGFYNNAGYRADGSVYAFEVLTHGKRNIPYCPECMSMHFPFEKKSRPFPGDAETLPLLKEYLNIADSEEFSRDFLTYERYLEEFDKASSTAEL